MKSPVYVLGLGIEQPPCLSQQAQDILCTAEILIGGKRQLAGYPQHGAQKIVIKNNIDTLADRIRQRAEEKIVILASGDPGFHGIAGALVDRLPGEDIRMIPNVSSLQAAFARIGVPWHDAIWASAHVHSLDQIAGWVKRAPKLGILTDPQHTPAVIAEFLLRTGMRDCRAVVAENLGTSTERITDMHLSALFDRAFDPLNVLLILQGEDWRPEALWISREDQAYHHRHGLITKRDLRTLCISRMNLRPTDLVWDIGAGSGAVSIEMAQLAWQGRVYAIEKDDENLGFIEMNCRKYGAANVEIIPGEAPDVLQDLLAPQAVFIGGSGGRLEQILRMIHARAPEGCRIVCNFATLENLVAGLNRMKELHWQPSFRQVSISYSHGLSSLTRLEPLNPVFILEGNHP